MEFEVMTGRIAPEEKWRNHGKSSCHDDQQRVEGRKSLDAVGTFREIIRFLATCMGRQSLFLLRLEQTYFEAKKYLNRNEGIAYLRKCWGFVIYTQQ
jgi:hypothetical protein